MAKVIAEVVGLYKIIKLDLLRATEGVVFDKLPLEYIPQISAIDRVLHEHHAISPGAVGDVLQPWYLHHYQEDHLLVLHGERTIELYTKEQGKITSLRLTPNEIYLEGELVCTGGTMLTWPRGVFHRITSGKEGSASLNIARHYEGFDIRTNFDIYQLDPETGDNRIIRAGYKDQFLDDKKISN
ncbi:MAG: hypothetical protein WCI30_07085 [Clostridia bacterium]